MLRVVGCICGKGRLATFVLACSALLAGTAPHFWPEPPFVLGSYAVFSTVGTVFVARFHTVFSTVEVVFCWRVSCRV